MARFPLFSTEALEALNKAVTRFQDECGGYDEARAYADSLWPTDWIVHVKRYLAIIEALQESAIDSSNPFDTEAGESRFVREIPLAYANIAALMIAAHESFQRLIAKPEKSERER